MTIIPGPHRLDTALLIPGPNPRGDLGDLTDLRASITQLEVQNPLVVRPHPDRPDRYEIIDGHRRYQCALRVGVKTLPAVLRHIPNKADVLLLQLTLHVHHAGFHPMAEAHAIATLMFTHHHTREQVAALLGKSPGWVRDRLALLRLSPGEQNAVARHDLPVTAAIDRVRSHRPTTARNTASPATRRQTKEPHLNAGHRLAEPAGRRCRETDTHLIRPWIGGVACGECWEAAIRLDATASMPNVAAGAAA